MRVMREILFIVYFCVVFLLLAVVFWDGWGSQAVSIGIATAASAAIAEWFTRAKPAEKMSSRQFCGDIALTVLPVVVFVTSLITKLFWDISGAGASGSNATGPMFGLWETLLLSALIVLICMVPVLYLMRRSNLYREAR